MTLKSCYVYDFYCGYVFVFLVVYYNFSVGCWFAFGVFCMFKSYKEVAYIISIIYRNDFSRQFQSVFFLYFLQDLFYVYI